MRFAGHSYGACVALEFAARRPERLSAVWCYEPPYGPAARGADRSRIVAIGERTIAAAMERGPAAAGEAFFAAVVGKDALERLSAAARCEVRQAGGAAVAEAPLLGLDLDGLSASRCPVALVVGGESPPMYRKIAGTLAACIPSGGVEILPGVDHRAPINRPDVVAQAIIAFAARLGA
ncbi:MAG TPA: alpha/beta hydrolase [Candidatus Caenarcaniphilales bacterium]|nr:alpha/beta hydrolase [Candidatus Caenarcaniphilales bacterium]